MFKEQFLAKFGDDRTTATLINDFSNIKTKTCENIKVFNSRFNKLLNEIHSTAFPGEEVQIEWYISSLPSKIYIYLLIEKNWQHLQKI